MRSIRRPVRSLNLMALLFVSLGLLVGSAVSPVWGADEAPTQAERWQLPSDQTTRWAEFEQQRAGSGVGRGSDFARLRAELDEGSAKLLAVLSEEQRRPRMRSS